MLDGNGNRSEFEYDARNRPIKTTVAAGTPVEAATRVFYDKNSNVVTRVDSGAISGSIPTRSAKGSNQRRSDEGRDDYTYTSNGLVSTLTNANSNTTTYGYDTCCSRLLTVTDPMSHFKSLIASSKAPAGRETMSTNDARPAIAASTPARGDTPPRPASNRSRALQGTARREWASARRGRSPRPAGRPPSPWETRRRPSPSRSRPRG